MLLSSCSRMWVVVISPRPESFSLPIEDKKTARGGLAAMTAFLMAAMRACCRENRLRRHIGRDHGKDTLDTGEGGDRLSS